MAGRGRPRIYSSDAERVQAWRDRERVKREEQQAIDRERYRLYQLAQRHLRDQETTLLSMARCLSERIHAGDKFAGREGLPNGHTLYTEALDVLERELRSVESGA